MIVFLLRHFWTKDTYEINVPSMFLGNVAGTLLGFLFIYLASMLDLSISICHFLVVCLLFFCKLLEPLLNFRADTIVFLVRNFCELGINVRKRLENDCARIHGFGSNSSRHLHPRSLSQSFRQLLLKYGDIADRLTVIV